MNQHSMTVYELKGHRGDTPIEGFIGVDGQKFLGFIDDALPRLRTIRGKIQDSGTEIRFSIPLSPRTRYVATLHKNNGTEGIPGTYVGQGTSVRAEESNDGLVARMGGSQPDRPVDHIQLQIASASEPKECGRADWFYKHLGDDNDSDQ